MAVRLTAAQARKLGVDVKTKTRTTQKVAVGAPYLSECVTCHERFVSEAAEERHLHEHHHARYRLVLTQQP